MDPVLTDLVKVDANIRSGVPVIKGTRVPASQILAELADNRTIAEIADDLEIDKTAIQEFIHGLSGYFDRPWIGPPVPCTVESIDGDEAICLVEIHGCLLPVKFPSQVLEKHDLSEGDRFSWRIRPNSPITEKDIESLGEPTLTEKEERELERLRLGRELDQLSKEFREMGPYTEFEGDSP